MIQQLFQDPLVNDLVLLGAGFLFVVLVIGLSMIFKKADMISGHTARKIVHLLCGFAVFIVPFLYIPHLALIISGTFLIVLRLSSPKTTVFQMMGEKNEAEAGYLAGPFSYALAINILVVIFGFMPHFFFFPAACIMVMMISDTAASFFGRRYGKHKINFSWTNTVRSVEGCMAMFITAFGLSLFAFFFFGNWFPNNHHTMSLQWIFILSGLVAGVSTIIEVVSPSNLDDLIVPIAGCFLSFLLTVALFPGSIGLI